MPHALCASCGKTYGKRLKMAGIPVTFTSAARVLAKRVAKRKRRANILRLGWVGLGWVGFGKEEDG